MKIKRSTSSWVAALSVAVAALACAGAAQAGDNVYWSVGMSAPGMQVGVANAVPVVQQVYMPRQPVYMAPQPVYVQPAPVYMARPQYVQTGWERPDYGRRWHHGHRHHRHDRSDHGHRGYDRD